MANKEKIKLLARAIMGLAGAIHDISRSCGECPLDDLCCGECVAGALYREIKSIADNR